MNADNDTLTTMTSAASSPDDPEAEEGLSFLLGGLDIQDVNAHAWEQEEIIDTPTRDGTVRMQVVRPQHTQTNSDFQPVALTEFERRMIFANAHHCTKQGQLTSPPVQIVSSPSKGNALVATRDVAKGETIYTERAAVATHFSGRNVRACQFCFKSLAPASAAVERDNDNEPSDESSSPLHTSLPDTDLWPVPEFDFSETNDTTNDQQSSSSPQSSSSNLRTDKHGRIHCTDCDSWFCHQYCYQQCQHEIGNHCLCRRALDHLSWTLREPNTAAIALATRMFAMAIQLYRKNSQHTDGSNQNAPPLASQGCWQGLCGDARDITHLRIGFPNSHDDNDATSYSLQHFYDEYVQLWSLTADEQRHISCSLLEHFAAMAARNGFDIRTQSPFTSYYNALLRRHGGRGSLQHEAIKRRVAQALGGTSSLQRGMDRLVNDRVAVDVVAIMPLTARINHSCCSEMMGGNSNNDDDKDNDNSTTTGLINAQVMSQVFVDARIDLVATRNIRAGQEILISYLGTPGALGVRNKNTHQRQEALQSKYLFHCDCPRCAEQPMLIPTSPANPPKSAKKDQSIAQINSPPSATESNPHDLTIIHDCYCPACEGGHATSTILPTTIPAFREIIVLQLTCPECGFRNAETTFAGQIQSKGTRITLQVESWKDLNRQMVKSDTTTIWIPSMDLEMPPSTQKGTISTLEGILRKAANTIESQQAERLQLGDLENFHRCHAVIEGLRQCVDMPDENDQSPSPFQVIVDDPAGNSFVENLHAPSKDPQLHIERYIRSSSQNNLLGLPPEMETTTAIKDLPSTNTASPVQNTDFDFARDEPVVFPGHCPHCQNPTETRMCLTDIPHFKQVILMSMVCSDCGYKSNEVKGGGAIPAKGQRVTLLATRGAADLSREVICSDTAGMAIPELELEMNEGGMDGIYTTVEGLLTKVRDRLVFGNPFASGDSVAQHHATNDGTSFSGPDRRHVQYRRVLDALDNIIRGERLEYTLVLTDPLANSFIGPLADEDTQKQEEDSAIVMEDLERTFAQNESLGLNDLMNSTADSTYTTYPPPTTTTGLTNSRRRGADHPHWTAKAPVDGDTTLMGPPIVPTNQLECSSHK